MKNIFLLVVFCLWAGGAWADRTTTICASGCDQTSIANWLTNVVPATLTQNEIADIQGNITETVTIGTGKTTTTSNRLIIQSSYNQGLANWKAGNGYSITGVITAGVGAGVNAWIDFKYIEIIGRLTGTNSQTRLTTSQVIIHGGTNTLWSCGANNTCTAINTVVYDNNTAGNFSSGFQYAGTGSMAIYNSVCYKVRYYCYDKNAGGSFTVENSYAGDCAKQGSGACFTISSGTNNMADDTSATTVCTTGCANSKSATNQFKSITAGSENFAIKAGADLISAGKDESGVFTNDILNLTRTTWDIGAYKYIPISTATMNNCVVRNATIN